MSEEEEEKYLLSEENFRPICIPIVGGPGSGKTALLSAFINIVSGLSERCGWDVKEYNNKGESDYQNYQKYISDLFVLGASFPTNFLLKKECKNLKRNSVIPLRLIISGKEFNKRRSVLLYDVAGESFTGASDVEIQRQFQFCNGLIIVVDPFNIESVHSKYYKNLCEYDSIAINNAENSYYIPYSTDEIINNLINSLHDLTGLPLTESLKIPTAVVITKTDAEGLKDLLGPDAIKDFMKRNNIEDKLENEMDVEDHICRKFLCDNGLANEVNIIDMKFPNNRYFSFSAIGHPTQDNNKEVVGYFKPIRIIELILWLFNQIDPDTKKKWNYIKYTNIPRYRDK